MKHKAWLSVVLAALLVISMTACGKTAADGTVPSEQPASDAESPESAAAENPVPEKALPAKPRSRRKPGSRPAEKTSAD